jgi:hypothetical protein
MYAFGCRKTDGLHPRGTPRQPVAYYQRMVLVHVALALVAAFPAAPPSTDPYTASLRYAQCMRAHGVPHPNPDRRGDFHLSAAQERRMRAVAPSIRKAAGDACFHHLKGLDLRPLTPRAQLRAIGVLKQVAACMRGYGYEMGRPVVGNMSRGRAFFGFKNPSPKLPSAGFRRADRTCEKRVNLAGKLDRIIAEDRSGL